MAEIIDHMRIFTREHIFDPFFTTKEVGQRDRAGAIRELHDHRFHGRHD